MVSTRVTISDVVTTDTTFYYRRFETFPSTLATLDYSVTFNLTKIKHQCTRGRCTVFLDIYTTDYDKNLKTNCSNDGFGQLRNENLRTPLRPRSTPYRFTVCKLDEKESDVLYCEGKTIIQDFKPRHYGFSFSYKCDIFRETIVGWSLVQLHYFWTIKQSTVSFITISYSWKTGEVQRLL